MPHLRSTSRRCPAALLAAVFPSACASPAPAQLREQQTLVVYDSRIADSLAVAEFYAGSANVPGGAGSMAGIHPGVLTLDISTRTASGAGGGAAGVFPAQANIDYPTFDARLRDPLRSYLAQANLTRQVRCIVLTKGLPHRILNITATAPFFPTIGDDPGSLNNVINAGLIGNFTYCCVDSELSLLQQSLDLGESGGNADSRADGMISNPYWRSAQTINAYSSRYNQTSKVWVQPGAPYNGFYWLNQSSTISATALNPGDIYLVCRLDGNSVADVTAMITRAQNLALPTAAAALPGATPKFLLDSDGNSLDGTGSPPQIDSGPDYSLTNTAIASDGRFPAPNVVFDLAGGFTGFHVGPLLTYATATNGPPVVMPNPLLLLASFGANHSGVGGNGSNANTTYAASFTYLPGAVFNTIESYNGRAFGGLGQNPPVPQQQAADAIAAGVTFAVGNVWEPFALSVADNEQIVKNFFLGNMTWGEAAYTALPVLSWQQIVVGDPLARPRRDREDINADGRANIEDLYAWYAAPVDLNNNGTPDDADFRLLESSVRRFEHASMKADQR